MYAGAFGDNAVDRYAMFLTSLELSAQNHLFHLNLSGFHDISHCGPSSKLWLVFPLDLVSYCLYAPKIIVVCLSHDQLCKYFATFINAELENGPMVPSGFNVSVCWWSLQGVVFSGAVLFLAKTP
ncbi:hypothetical protein PILCRDRAFT_720443 [Piloderma croceum F 1598]|uniref:Uncharacterized protein n=1 Tax=Piloderma croceum (strain F 1598) TaxID=765440 RepID=A0A0C3F0U5_PILCF|nr:hypothetical protein PILCRDRAFT_720443 [Piloderma croceum F 1598]